MRRLLSEFLRRLALQLDADALTRQAERRARDLPWTAEVHRRYDGPEDRLGHLPKQKKR